MATNPEPLYLVTVLKDGVPIAMVEVQKDGEDTERVEAYHLNTEGLSLAHAALMVAAHGVGFIHWKETGVLLEARGFEEAPEDPIAPF